MSSFWLFLAERKPECEKALARLAVERLSSAPPVAEVVHALGLISDRELLRALAIQADAKVDFKNACIQAGVWSNEFDSRVNEERARRATSVFKSLVDSRLLGFEDLVTLYQEYQGHRTEAGSFEVAPQTREAQPASTSRHWRLELFSESRRGSFRQRVDALESSVAHGSEQVFLAVVQHLFNELHLLLGIACFVDCKPVEELCLSWERTLSLILRSQRRPTGAHCRILVKLGRMTEAAALVCLGNADDSPSQLSGIQRALEALRNALGVERSPEVAGLEKGA